MYNHFKIVFFVLAFFSFPLWAQIYSPDPHSSVVAAYDASDSVLIFPVNVPGNINAVSIAAYSPDSLDGWTFRWYVYDQSIPDYQLINTTSGDHSSIDTITTFAGYRLIMNKGAQADTSNVWINFDDFNVEIISKDENGNIPNIPNYVRCDRTIIISRLDSADLFYYEPGTADLIRIYNAYRVNWEKDTEEGSSPDNRIGPAFVGDPPYEDTWYTINVIDNFNVQRSDSVFYVSIRPKADLEYAYIPLTDTAYYPAEYSYLYQWDKETTSGTADNPAPAPAKFKFMNGNSKNAYKFTWSFGDDSTKSTSVIADTIVHNFLFPGKYTPQLVAFGPVPNECKDTVTLNEKPVYLSASYVGEPDSLKFPNVFTPNGDHFNSLFKYYQEHGSSNDANTPGYLSNSLFRPYDISIYEFSIVIFNRYGKKVHEYSGNMRDWPGWDGKIMNSDRDASEGVYYYVVDMILGFKLNTENELSVKKFSKKQQTGFVHLFREPKR